MSKNQPVEGSANSPPISNPIDIYYFSGTGNTRKVSEMLQDQLKSMDVDANLISIEDVIKSGDSIDVSRCRMLGLAYPIYGFGTSAIIQDFIKRLPEGNGLKLFILKTGADNITLNHNASTKSINALEESGYDVFYDRIIVMPSNWVVQYSKALNRQLIEGSSRKVRHMCLDILDGTRRRYKTGRIMRSISFFIADREERYGASYFGQSLRANSFCSSCGLCVKNCPVDNIKQTTENVTFGDKCIWCMRCIYNCPEKAIDSKGYKFCILKKGYSLKKIMTGTVNPKKYVTAKTRGYFKHLYKYLQDESV